MHIFACWYSPISAGTFCATPAAMISGSHAEQQHETLSWPPIHPKPTQSTSDNATRLHLQFLTTTSTIDHGKNNIFYFLMHSICSNTRHTHCAHCILMMLFDVSIFFYFSSSRLIQSLCCSMLYDIDKSIMGMFALFYTCFVRFCQRMQPAPMCCVLAGFWAAYRVCCLHAMHAMHACRHHPWAANILSVRC